MAKLGCPCGNTISNSCELYEAEYDFVPFSSISENYEDRSFFDLRHGFYGSTNIWHCSECGRLMVFDTEPYITRWMKPIDINELPKSLEKLPCAEGYIHNDLLFNAVDEYFTQKWEESNKAFDYTWSYLCPRLMEEEVFSGANGRFGNWWYCRNYKEYIVFYEDRAMDVPIRAWERYDQVLDDED